MLKKIFIPFIVLLLYVTLTACSKDDDYSCQTDDYSSYNCSQVTSCATSDGDSCKYIVNDVTYNCGSCTTLTSSSQCVTDAVSASCSNAKMSETENELLKSLLNEKINNLELNLELFNSLKE